MRKARQILYRFMIFTLPMKLYEWCLRYFADIWVIARFYAAWIEYQRSDHYSIRTTTLGFRYAFQTFFDSAFEQKYLLKIRLQKEPALWWRITCAPWTVAIPAVLETAAREEFFKK